MRLVSSRTFAAVAAAALAASLSACSQQADGDLTSRDGDSSGKPLTTPVAMAPMIRGSMPIRNVMRTSATNTAPAGSKLTYRGGNVISAASYTNVYWGSYWTSGTGLTERQYMNAFMGAVGTSQQFASVLAQYTGKNGAVPGVGTYSGEKLISGEPGGTSKTITDAQIQTAIDGWISQGLVPANNPNTLYNIFFPPNVTIQMDSSNASCAQFCGYHSAAQTTRGTGGAFRYIIMPYPGCNGCNFASTAKDSLTVIDSHEMSEAITDPDVGIAITTNLDSWLGWYDDNNGEIGDICASDPNGTITVNGTAYVVQSEWSNADNKCVVSRGTTTTPDFSLSASPGSQSVTAGGSTSYTVSVAASGGFNGAVSFSVSGAPSGVSASVSGSVTGSGNATLNVSTTSAAAAATSTLTITATGGGKTHSATVSLTVNAASQADFSLAASAPSVALQAGGSGKDSISVSATGGFASAVTFTVSGLPSGVTAAFNPASVTGAGTTIVAFTAAASAPTGSGTATITGTAGSLSHSATVAISVAGAAKPDFSLAVSPGSAAVTAGSSASASVTVGASNGFTGAVALSVSGAPSGVTATLDHASLTGSGTATMSVATDASTAAGTYTLTVAGASGSLSHSASFALTVNAPPPPPGGNGVVFSDDAENGMSQWTTYATSKNAKHWGIETSGASHSGTHRFRSNPNANYANNEATFLISNSFSLAGAGSATLTFFYKFSTEDQFDYFYVWASGDDGATWVNIAEGTGTSQGWNHWAPQASLDLSQFAGSSNVRIAFSLQTDYSVTDWGVGIDDVVVTAN